MKRIYCLSAAKTVGRTALPVTNNKPAFRAVVMSVLIIATTWLAVPALAQSLSGSFDGVGTLTTTSMNGIYMQSFTGDGSDDTYGAFDAASQGMIDFSHPPHIVITDTMWSQTFSDGTLFGSGSGTGTGNGHGMATFMVDLAISGGTGTFEGLHGNIIVTGTITQTGPLMDAVDATYTGNLVTPEPSSLSLLLLGAGFGYRLVVRKYQARSA